MAELVIRRKKIIKVRDGKACSSEGVNRESVKAANYAESVQSGNAGATSKIPLKVVKNKPDAAIPPRKTVKRKKRIFDKASDGIDLLVEHWPQLFSHTEPKPIELGIWCELTRSEKVSRRRLRAALKIYCHSRMYRQAIAAGGARYDLNGKPSQAISEEHLLQAKSSLEGKKQSKV